MKICDICAKAKGKINTACSEREVSFSRPGSALYQDELCLCYDCERNFQTILQQTVSNMKQYGFRMGQNSYGREVLEINLPKPT